ncbi:hypothetical protein PZ897_05055 [Hoeflea sp. YIM 152468]|uniref:hypothetical protein n=1 Tax=Hoeflea sp. YIM 152468 TaxID=3031759 RepID=UPI0023DC6C97|nr:hypothetical protein [Hoeflea sp. YIM 152468]MDF1607537.1 hypothetical protein [Hoeflea sp. YIM 152468]
MKPHPLTPRQPVLLANVLQAVVTIAVSCGLFAAMMTVLPPIAWIGHLDEARNANMAFLFALLGEYVGSSVQGSNTLGALVRLIDLPVALASALSSFGVALPISIRGTAALLVGAIVGLEARLRTH